MRRENRTKPRFLTPSSFLHEMQEDVVEGAKSCD